MSQSQSEAPAPSRWGDLGKRTLSALVLGPIFLLDLYAGGLWAEWLFAIIAVLMALEYTSIVHAGDKRQFAFHALAGLAAAMLAPGGWLLATITIIVVASIMSVMMRGRDGVVPIGWWATTGVAYVAVPTMALALLRNDADRGWDALLWLALVVWSTDIGAYFAGRSIGGPKLVPRLSPKKTWAGLGGGVAAAAAASWLTCLWIGVPPTVPALIAALLAIVAQAGDIYESALKRQFNLKDASNLIPGHGGILDRVDGLVAAAVVAAVIGFLHNPESVAKGLLFW